MPLTGTLAGLTTTASTQTLSEGRASAIRVRNTGSNPLQVRVPVIHAGSWDTLAVGEEQLYHSTGQYIADFELRAGTGTTSAQWSVVKGQATP